MKIVLKVGTSSLVDRHSGQINELFFDKLCFAIGELMSEGHQVALVTSGAVGLGRIVLGSLDGRYSELAQKNKSVCAGVGQHMLMQYYSQLFGDKIITVQFLLAGKADYGSLTRHNLEAAMSAGLLPIINANDTVYDEQIRIGDNDTLSAEVSKLINADKLIMITDIEGFKLPNSDGTLGEVLREASAHEIGSLAGFAGGSGSSVGIGGMKTKLEAAKIATACGCDMYIVSNKEVENLPELVSGGKDIVSTRFIADGRSAQL